MLSLQNSYISHVSHVAHIIIVTWLQFLMYGSSMCFHRDLSFHFFCLVCIIFLDKKKDERKNVCYILTRFFEYSNFLLHPRTNKFWKNFIQHSILLSISEDDDGKLRKRLSQQNFLNSLKKKWSEYVCVPPLAYVE